MDPATFLFLFFFRFHVVAVIAVVVAVAVAVAVAVVVVGSAGKFFGFGLDSFLCGKCRHDGKWVG